MRIATVTLLEALGYRTLEACTVQEALGVFADNPAIGLVLTDVVLPGGKHGDDLAQSVRALQPEAKVLFMSGYTDDILTHNGRLDTGVTLLRKPFTRSQLAATVRAVIDGVQFDPTS
jgi:CheY-like chemotaxis protein